MASSSIPAPLRRSETELKKSAFRDYARSKFDKRDDRRPDLPYLNVIESEERRISKIRERFKGKAEKLGLLNNVAKSRKRLIQHLSEKTKKAMYKGSPLDEQEAESSNGLKNETVKELDEKIREPIEEFRAGVMYFKKGQEGKWHGEQCGDVDPSSGDFPNQKIKMDTILFDTSKNHKLFKSDGESIKYFHFPANHMEWIETALERYHQVNTESEDDNEQVLETGNFKSPLLSREHWRGQLHSAGMSHMRPRCAHVSDDTDNNAPSNVAVFLPYLHWETNRRRSMMTQIFQEVVKDNRASMVSRIVTVASKKATCLRPKFNRELISSEIGQYLYDVAQVWDAMDCEADERLLRQSFSEIKQGDGASVPQRKWVPPLHIRRTLDQSYFSTVEDTAARDTDQVVYRQTRAGRQKHQKGEQCGTATSKERQPNESGNSVESSTSVTAVASTCTSALDTRTTKNLVKLVGVTRVVMVDQLWMWILGEVFFDRTQPTDDRPEVMDLFAQAIGAVAYHTAAAYSVFWLNVNLHSSNTAKFNNRKAESFRYLNINPEGILLKESQDITEELKIMEGQYKHQLAVVSRLSKHLKNRLDKVSSSSGESEAARVAKLDFEEAADLIEKIKERTAEIEDLQSAAARSNEQLQALMSLKQQEASIVEARAALQQGEESVKQGQESIKQGRAIMAFTIVTIFFVPLGFFTGFFGMNNENSTGNEWMTMGEQITYMFVISVVISTVVLGVAFRNMGVALPFGLRNWRFKKPKEDESEV
ncbi:hypothetical protein TRIATDRAFT_316977 [Trichoderma atroviride IMI 206040]|uniref:Uncharacterized protein n=1 Tax=Hypocrea atroviridis (strain ATCC 20476 / IMI 206040) TaxID=452589 RepID=G9NR32_HYPAI|nr:uncharacterized protein TRIATDRAFT_316977 [Trichoderma atroviride IMI 206040]EHK47002.1 hypothetical protein TRIATDRAFT_316977 [Trichoderma atroviride IMI 206040]